MLTQSPINSVPAQAFQILDFVDSLVPAKEANKYICPVCEDDNLGIDPKTGKYQCFSTGCSCADIREAIKPWKEVLAERHGESFSSNQINPKIKSKSRKKAKALPAPPVPHSLKLAKIENTTGPDRLPISDTLWSIVRKEILKKTPGINREDVWEIAYSYGGGKIVCRVEWADATSDKGYRKTYRQSHIDDGLVKWEKGKAIWSAYRINEVLAILGDTPVNEPVAPLMVEGEPNVEIARSHGIASITLQGSNWAEEQIKSVVAELQRVNCRALPYIYDNDETGVAKANKIKSVCDRLQFPCILIDPKVIWRDIPEKGDIKEILAEMSTDDFIRRIEDELHSKAQEDKEHRENLAIGDDDSNGKKSDKPPLPQIIGGEFAEDLRERLLYSEQHKSWMAYELNLKGVWTAVGDDYVLSAIETMCRQREIRPNNSYVANVLGTLKRILFCLEWTERPSCEMLPFEDGVLQIETTIFREHTPGDRLTWSLERPYRGSAVRSEGWGAIAQWLSEATEGNARKQEILLAFAAAALRGMSSVQKFLMLTGPGGTGKGVFSHLLTLVLGERNTWIGNLEDLNKPDRVAELQTKRLALFDDQERYMGNLSNFRSLTGGGKISGRQLYKSAINFKFNGLALVTANQPCFPATGISWLKRRIIQQEFRHQPAKRNIHLQGQLAPELSAFTRHLLSIPVGEIERLLGEEMTGLNHTFWEDRIQADPLASWINDNLIHDATAEVAIGSDKDEWKDGNYDAARSTAFGSYNYICRSGNSIPLSKNKFSANLIELCQGVLGWRDVAKTRKGDARYIVGVRLRTPADTAILPLDQTLNDDDRQHDVNLDVNPNPIHSMGCADVDNLLQTFSEKNTTNLELTQNMEIQSNFLADSLLIEKLGDDTANVSTPHIQQETRSSQSPTSTSSSRSSQVKLLLLQDYARRMGEALGYKSPATARAIAEHIQTSVVNRQITESELIEIAGIDNWQAFNKLRSLTIEEEGLVEIIQRAIAGNDAETAKTALATLKQVCDSGAADRHKVWFTGLTESERVAFSALSK